MSKLDHKPTSKASAAHHEFIEHADLSPAAHGPREADLVDVIADGEREVSPCPAPPQAQSLVAREADLNGIDRLPNLYGCWLEWLVSRVSCVSFNPC
jgi:hypothetical protein